MSDPDTDMMGMIVHHSPVPMAVIKEKYLFVNDAFCEFLGYSKDELFAMRDACDILPDRVREVAKKRFESTISLPGSHHTDETMVYTKSGQVKWVQMTANSVSYQGQVVTIVALMDITDRKYLDRKLKESEKLFQIASENLRGGIAVFDFRGIIRFITPSIESVTGFSPEELIGRPIFDFIDKNSESMLKAALFRRSLGELDYAEYILTLYRKDGTAYDSLHRISTIEYEGEKAAITAFIDITERKEFESKLRESEEMFRTISELTMAGIYMYQENFTYVNDALCQISGYSREELLEMKPIDLVHPSDAPHVGQIINSRFQGFHQSLEYEIRFLKKSGNYSWVHISSSSVMYKGERTGIGVALEITDRKNLENKLHRLASIDSLTRIYNRRKFQEIVTNEWERHARYRQTFSIIMFDLDNFKHINDTYGHHYGDKVLVKTITQIKRVLRKSDIMARWGGEEFMVLLPQTHLEQAMNAAEKIRQRVEHTEIDPIGHVTISVGVAEILEHESLENLYTRADQALYQSKKDGKNRVTGS